MWDRHLIVPQPTPELRCVGAGILPRRAYAERNLGPVTGLLETECFLGGKK